MVLDRFRMKWDGRFAIVHGALSSVGVCALHGTRAVLTEAGVSMAHGVISTNKEVPLVATFELTR